MKTYIVYLKTIVSLGLLLGVVSCGDWLDEELETSYSQEELYKTVSGIEGVLAGAWQPLTVQNCYSQVYPALNMGLSGGFIYNQSGAAWNAVSKWQMVSSYTNLYNYWTHAYKAIGRCNNLLYYTSGSPVEQAAKDRLTGEAYLLRAMMYFDLVRMFGGVPLRLQPTDENAIYAPRASAAEVYGQIIEDLIEAEHLMADAGQQKAGRPHRWAATALKAKVYLVMAGNRPSAATSLDLEITDEMLQERYLEPDKSPERATNFWLLAYKSALSVYNSGHYSLVKNFDDLWDASKQNSKESIIEIQNSASMPGAMASIARVFVFKNSDQYAPLASTYLGALRPKRQTYRLFSDGDPRRDASFITGVKSVRNTSTGVVSNTPMFPSANAAKNENYPYVRKYKDPSVGANGAGNENILYLRFAEIYLILAESVNEIEGPVQAYPYVNAVLNRARTSPPTASSVPKDWDSADSETTVAVADQAAFRKEILLERFRELMAEFNEFSDYRRRGIDRFRELLVYQNQDYQDPSQSGYDVKFGVEDPVWMKRYMLMPIPLTEINENVDISVVDQNFGY